ncbi:MAG TPA: hypothetical protein VL522_14650 [Bordetella sp.]|nr:hypothetical protein [Bordetella sp.]
MAEAPPQAHWTPATAADVRQARALCAEHAVQLALAGSTVSTEGRPVLWVDPARLNGLTRLPGAVERWRAGPGVMLGELARAGLPQFADAAPDRTLADWFADRGAAAWPTGRGDLSGVHAADVLLADGVADTLGPFGADDGQPLRSAALQQLVPALFRLASGTEAQWCREQPAWPARYRLDALLPAAPATLNLARMLHGHGGTLAWLESLVLQAPDNATDPLDNTDASSADRANVTSDQGLAALPWTDSRLPPAQARALDMRIKSNFDPAGVFPEPA